MSTVQGFYEQFPGWTRSYCGKVRDMFVATSPESGVATDAVLMVASDRISAFDRIIPTDIPRKGEILTQITLWWIRKIEDKVPHHVLSSQVPADVSRRAIVCRRISMIPVECLVRGYIIGAVWDEYKEKQSVGGEPIPPGIEPYAKLPQPIFTPFRKGIARGEHDESVTFSQLEQEVGVTLAEQIKQKSLEIYTLAAEVAEEHNLILADTKFEFGHSAEEGNTLFLGDEVLTPDSSRYWILENYQSGVEPEHYDKQFVRNYLLSEECEWDPEGELQPPPLPKTIAGETLQRYREVYRRLTGGML